MKKTLVMALGMLSAVGMSAAPITPQQALSALKSSRLKALSTDKVVQTPVYTARTANGTSGAYVFNYKSGRGYVVLAADDAAYPVLGYSDQGSVNVSDMSPELKWWLDRVSAQIEYYASRGISVSAAVPHYAGMERIDALVESKWNQDEPYNNDAPQVNNRRTYTGCVATSMAQVMNYHKYPEVGEGSIRYSWNSTTLSMNFSDQKFDWANMLDVYAYNRYNTEQAAAVAYLMKACGYSVQMNYGLSASGTQGSIICDALKTYFKYDQNTNVQYRAPYSATEWANMVYDNLKNVGPVILNGHEYQGGGHSFICDGYDGSGYFHFNWGWGGMSDGWFLLEAMNPDAQGIGGADAAGGFNYGLNGIFGIQPPTGKPAETFLDNILMSGAASAVLTGADNNVIQYSLSTWYPSGWYCASGHAINVSMGIIIDPVDGTKGEQQVIRATFNGSTRIRMNPGVYYNTLNGPNATLPKLDDGKYKLTIGVKDLRNNDNPYVPILCPYAAPNYVYLTVSGGKMTVQNVAVPKLEPKSLKLDTPLYYGKNAEYTAMLANNSEYELTETLAPGLLQNGKLVMVGMMGPTTVNAGFQGDVKWKAIMQTVNGAQAPVAATQYELAIVNPVTMEVMGKYGDVTMQPSPGTTRLNLESIEVPGCERIDVETPNGKAKVYMVPGDGKFNIKLKYSVWNGFFDGTLSASIYMRNPDNWNDIEPVEMGIYTEQPFMEIDKVADITIPVDFKGITGGDIYNLRIVYTDEGAEKNLTNFNFMTVSAGVNEIHTEDAVSAAEYYNLQGMRINNPVKGQLLIRKDAKGTAKIMF